MIEGWIFFTIGVVAYLINKVVKIKKENAELKVLFLQQHYSSQEDKDTAREDFLKFIAESREMAFEYIEEVQNALEIFKDKVEKDLKYFDKYGDPMAMQPNYQALQNISAAYKELKQIFPEEIKDA